MVYLNIVTAAGVNKQCRYKSAEAAARDLLGKNYIDRIDPRAQLNTVEDKALMRVSRRYERFLWCESESLSNERFEMLRRSYRKRWN